MRVLRRTGLGSIVDEELVLQVDELPTRAVEAFADRDMLEDAWGEDEA